MLLAFARHCSVIDSVTYLFVRKIARCFNTNNFNTVVTLKV
jgi:hypothetical protein